MPPRSLPGLPYRFPSRLPNHNSISKPSSALSPGLTRSTLTGWQTDLQSAPWSRTPASFLHSLYNKGEKVIIFDDYHSQGQEVWEHPGLPYDARTLNRSQRANAMESGS